MEEGSESQLMCALDRLIRTYSESDLKDTY